MDSVRMQPILDVGLNHWKYTLTLPASFLYPCRKSFPISVTSIHKPLPSGVTSLICPQGQAEKLDRLIKPTFCGTKRNEIKSERVTSTWCRDIHVFALCSISIGCSETVSPFYAFVTFSKVINRRTIVYNYNPSEFQHTISKIHQDPSKHYTI